jgi:2Fe-2S ferredoxin
LIKNIDIIVYKDSEKIVLHTFTNEYNNLMELLNETIYVQAFGECQGMGRCCTCIIEIVSKFHFITSVDSNEKSTLKRHKVIDSKYRLACQIMIDSNLHKIEISLT